MPMRDRVCVVTGASRGVGRGVAISLGAGGAVVYVTGRTVTSGSGSLPGTVHETAALVTAGGGRGVAVMCDHGNDEQVEGLFARVEREAGKLDVLVNCATVIPDGLTDALPFWKKSLAMTELFGVGLRSTYVSSYYAAPLLLKAGSGLVVNISSAGGRCYMHGPAYGACKAATDKMSHDMAHDFRRHNVAVVSLWPGLVKTERTLAVCEAEPDKYREFLSMAETPEFEGHVIAALFADPQRMERTGQVFYAAELALEYGIKDRDGLQPPSHRAFLGDTPIFSPAVVE